MAGEVFPLYECDTCGWCYRDTEDYLQKPCYKCKTGTVHISPSSSMAEPLGDIKKDRGSSPRMGICIH